jgi:hypothetical protein
MRTGEHLVRRPVPAKGFWDTPADEMSLALDGFLEDAAALDG